MARRDKLSDALLVHETENDENALRLLGSLIRQRPEISRRLPARKCAAATLRLILDGAISGRSLEGPSLLLLDALATDWLAIHPDLLDEPGVPALSLYQAMRLWQSGQPAQAAALLLDFIRPKPAPDAGSPPVRQGLASAAACVLADLIAESPGIDIKPLLPPDSVSRETLELLFKRLISGETRSLVRIRSAMTIKVLLKERFDSTGLKFFLTPHDARALARDAWMGGDDDLAFDLLGAAFLSDPDSEEHHDAAFVAVFALLGHGGQVLDDLDAAKSSLPDSVYRAKRARLLHALGRSKEAMETITGDHHPLLRLQLAIETGEWQSAISSIIALKPDSDKQRAAMNACVAILSGESKLADSHSAAGHPVIALLQGNALRDDDLAEMARDAELSSRRESLLTTALASGAPVSMRIMGEYLRFLDLLPDKQRTIRIARDLAKRDVCEINGSTRDEGCATAHKVLAAEALLLLGRGDFAFEAMRPVMAASTQPHDFKAAKRWGGGGYSQPLVAGYQQACRIAEMEWPQEAPAQRIGKLAAILGQPDPLPRARGMIDLIAKHEAAGLEKTELLRALWLPLCDLAQSVGVPADLKDLARGLLDKREPNDHEHRWLQSHLNPVPWEMDSSHPPVKGKPTTTITLSPTPGAKSDPKQPDFVIIDGIVAAGKLRQRGDALAARNLVRDIMLRLLLDTNSATPEQHWKFLTSSNVATRGWSFATRGFATVLQSFDYLELPLDLTFPFIDACTSPWTNYADEERLLYAARVLAKAGKHAESLAYYRRFLLMTIPALGSMDVGRAGRADIAEMQRVRGLLAAAQANREQTVDTVLHLVLIAPYQPELAGDIATALKQMGDTETLAAARSVIAGFWQTRLLEIPASATYQYWKSRWEAAFQ